MLLSDFYLPVCIAFPQPRLKCLSHIVRRLNEDHKDFITTLLPEVLSQISAGKHREMEYWFLSVFYKDVVSFR